MNLVDEQLSISLIQPQRGLASLKLNDLWHYRELLYFLVWRDVKVRYKQTALGVMWIVLQPLIQVVIFNIIFGVLLSMPTDGIPYPLFTLPAVLPWTYFAGSLSRASISLVGNSNLISKIYFPRLLIPISSVLAGLLDLGIGLVLLVPAMIFYRVPVTWNILAIPFFITMAMMAALAFSLWFSALNVRYRDVNYLIPFLIQIWMYLTPVFYGRALIPEKWYSLLILNPMTGVTDGVRWAILGVLPDTPAFFLKEILAAVIVIILVMAGGLIYFRRSEREFADVV